MNSSAPFGVHRRRRGLFITARRRLPSPGTVGSMRPQAARDWLARLDWCHELAADGVGLAMLEKDHVSSPHRARIDSPQGCCAPEGVVPITPFASPSSLGSRPPAPCPPRLPETAASRPRDRWRRFLDATPTGKVMSPRPLPTIRLRGGR